MTKSEFILSLSEALAHIPSQARARALEYFEEMIDDRVENGMSEEEAVAALGSIDEILKNVAPEASNNTGHSEEKTSDHNGKFIILHEPVQKLLVNSACADLTIRSEELPDGATCRVDFKLSKNAECMCTLENGQLKVQYKKDVQRRFSFHSLLNNIREFITITLNDPALCSGNVKASSGDVKLSKLVFIDSLDAGTASGDLTLCNVAVQNDCKLHIASGDISGSNLTCGDIFDASSASGDIQIDGIRAGKIAAHTASGDIKLTAAESDDADCSTTSGDIKIKNCKSVSLKSHVASGDIAVSNAECSESIELHSSSGDVALRESSCEGKIDLSSSNGDVKGSLVPAGAYTYSARARFGDVKIPQSSGIRPVQIHTTTGDIIFSES